MLVRDTRPVECRFFDRDDKFVGIVSLPPVDDSHEPRRMEFRGKRFIEGGDGSLYSRNEFAEVVSE